MSDCIFEIHHLSQSGFSRVYSNCCCRCSFEAEIIKIGQSSHKMYSNNMLNVQESTTILNVSTKKAGNFLKAPRNWRLLILNGSVKMSVVLYIFNSVTLPSPWRNDYCRKKQNQWSKFKSWTRLSAFYLAPIPLGKALIHMFSTGK